jgi:hypothetical protein
MESRKEKAYKRPEKVHGKAKAERQKVKGG